MIQFIFRLTFGVALAMSFTSPRLVTAGYFRVHLWVLLGLNTVAALGVTAGWERLHTVATPVLLLALAIALALLSYVGAVIWLYESARAGTVALVLVAAIALIASAAAGVPSRAPLSGQSAASTPPPGSNAADRPAARPVSGSDEQSDATRRITAQRRSATSNANAAPGKTAASFAVALIDSATSGLVQGSVLAAMFLGHWYLNSPGMQLAPLRRLVALVAVSVALRAVFCGAGGASYLVAAGSIPPFSFWAILSLRWLAGLAGTLVLAGFTWQTLKIPNTQSATGILYAAVVLALVGELTSQLLSARTGYPL